jgi:hypothetical protein
LEDEGFGLRRERWSEKTAEVMVSTSPSPLPSALIRDLLPLIERHIVSPQVQSLDSTTTLIVDDELPVSKNNGPRELVSTVHHYPDLQVPS